MFGNFVGAGSKRPYPSRIKTMMDFPIRENSSKLKRLLGFFAYNAKWVAVYSNKVAPLLTAQNQLAVPLNQASRLAIATLKKEVLSTLASEGKRAPRFSKQTRTEPVSERHTVRATNLSASSREL